MNKEDSIRCYFEALKVHNAAQTNFVEAAAVTNQTRKTLDEAKKNLAAAYGYKNGSPAIVIPLKDYDKALRISQSMYPHDESGIDVTTETIVK